MVWVSPHHTGVLAVSKHWETQPNLPHHPGVLAGHGPQHIIKADSDSPPLRYNFRKRSEMKMPARFGSNGAASPGKSSSVDNNSQPHDITSLLPPCALFRQPASEVHYDEMAEHGFGNHVDNAVFSHAWAPDGRGVFTCGGPLAMGVRGCYLSLWSQHLPVSS